MIKRRGNSPAFGARMKMMIKRSGMTQREVAEKMGIPETTLSRYIRQDREPLGPYLRAFALAVGCSVESLYREDDAIVKEEVMELWLKTANLVMAGEPVGSAVEKGSGTPLPEEDWRMLSEQTGNIRHILRQESDGDWDLLRDEEKREILGRIAKLAAGQENR